MDTWIVQAKKIMRDRSITQKDIASAMENQLVAQ